MPFRNCPSSHPCFLSYTRAYPDSLDSLKLSSISANPVGGNISSSLDLRDAVVEERGARTSEAFERECDRSTHRSRSGQPRRDRDAGSLLSRVVQLRVSLGLEGLKVNTFRPDATAASFGRNWARSKGSVG